MCTPNSRRPVLLGLDAACRLARPPSVSRNNGCPGRCKVRKTSPAFRSPGARLPSPCGSIPRLVPQLHQTNAPQSLRQSGYTGYEISGSARLQHGIFVFAGWTYEHTYDRQCDMNAVTGGAALNDPNSLRFCDWTGSLYQNLGRSPACRTGAISNSRPTSRSYTASNS